MAFRSVIDEIRAGIGGMLDDLSIPRDGVPFSVEPAKPGFGDASSNVSFLLAGRLGRAPGDVARMLSGMYAARAGPLVERCEAHGSGYLNFFADWPALARLTLTGAHSAGFGSARIGGGSTVVVEHTSVNPNKALHIGHVRNIVIGDTVARILRKAGYGVTVLNYVDDSGLQVADIVVGFRHLGLAPEPPGGKKFDHYCGDDVYVQTVRRYGEDPGLEEVRRRTLKELEDGDSQTAAFADGITRRVLHDQLRTCWNLGVSYDCLNFESHIIRSGMWDRVFARLRRMGLVELEDRGDNAGCWVFKGGGGPGPGGGDDKVIVRSNGTATYIAKDIPYAAWKLGLLEDPFGYAVYREGQPPDPSRVLWQTTLEGDAGGAAGGNQGEGGTADNDDDGTATATTAGDPLPPRFSGQRVVTVIDSRQAGLQRIIAALMARFKSVPDAYVHLGYESVTLSQETAGTLGMETGGRQAHMSGRKGLYVSADSVYDTLLDRARRETRSRHPDMDAASVDRIAHDISVGTIRYEMIKQDLDKIITFDLAASLSLEGDTAPYIQYTGARASRILERAGGARRASDPDGVDFSLLRTRPERDLIRAIGLLEMSVADAANNLSPKVVARYCHDLAVAFNSFYEKARVLGLDDAGLERSRLYLVSSFRSALGEALGLLGIAAPATM